MAITRVNVGTIASATSGNVTPALPASILANDILVCVSGAADNVVPTVPAAYTKKVDTNGGTTAHLMVAWARATGTDSAPLVTHTAGDSIFAFVVAYRGCTTTGDPFSAFASQSNTMLTGTTITAPTITPGATDMVIFACVNGEPNTNNGGVQSLSGWSGTNPTFTEFADYNDGGLGTRLAPGGAADGVTTPGGATGTRTVTLASAPTTGGFSVGALLSLTAGAAAVLPPLPTVVDTAVMQAANY